ncbi:MAG: glycan-binding surface protein [Rikenellaceae bacterium]
MRTKFIYILLALASTLLFVSCEKEEGLESEATPVVKYIRPTNAATSDSLLVSASMGSTIAIIGEGFAGVCEMWFNDQKARLNPTYITDNAIIVTVPGSMPGEITNTIKLITKKGKEATYDFAVIIPSPRVNSIDCEWAKDGSDVTILGDFFFADADGKIEVLFPGNLPGVVKTFNNQSITCTVPAGTLPGTITVTSLYGKGRSQFTFRDSEGLFVDGENPSAWNNWNLADFGTEGGLSGQYVKLEGTTGSWAWPANAIQFYYNRPGRTPIVTEGEVEDYALKFEYYCHEWHDTPFLLWFTSDEGSHNVDGADAQYHWKPYLNNGVKTNFTTPGWKTVTIPLSEFIYSKDESENSRKISSLNSLVDFHGMFFGAADGTYPVKLWMDNLRIVKIK